ncbi:E3 ubiquitin-protein ligase PRT1 isoform X1 [Vigna radiata var. radiata]|uniref:E3 ubiquitin-protein ligase PRT1 isoform X1 n=1 Tax=Vigna radiata var. radiata TaxID=3916 RepID=A0A1S3TWS1_VIGRR|nr:E3 ubiquitin-protein ligase PRT1 isoform X1 [Vigna radiata var. radiata]
MENNALRDRIFADNEHEEIPDSFVCCVCLDLLYKPIVLSCGHICCFWCVYNSMNCLRESQCPVCRHQYYHFPTVCQMLHFLLLKIYSVPYKRREEQTLEEEKKSGFYSPQFDPETCESQAKFGHSGIPSSTSIMNLTSNSCNGGTSECMEQSGSTTHERDEGTGYSNGEPDIVGTPAKRKKLPQEDISLQQKLSVADVTCTMCKQLLFHPVVLNCGHVYCQTCVVNTDDDMLRCQICQSPHPSRFPKVCLELDHFLEEQFPEEYRQRRDAIELQQIKVKLATPSCSLDKGNKGENTDWWSDPDSKVHVGVGCDFCGMFPIIGDRYRCADCTEKMGFDLCGDCYATRSKLPGRFNQQHTSEHKFKLEQSNIIQNIMLRLATAQLGDTSIDLESVGNLEIASDSPTMFDDGEDNHSDSETTN